MKLKELKLKGNNIKDFPKEILYLPKLQPDIKMELEEIHNESLKFINDKVIEDSLNLTNQNLTKIPEQVGKLINLKTLIFSWNRIDEISSNLWKVTSLTSLNLSNNSLTSLSWEIVLLKDLVDLDLSKNKLKSLPRELIYLKKLTNLNVFGNPLTESFPDFSKSNLSDESKEEVLEIKCQIQRNKIVDHLFETEKHYYSYMSILSNHFISPLKMKKKQPLSAELHKQYFNDVQVVLGITKEFLISLEDGIKDKETFDLGVMFLSFGSSFKLISKYINEAPLNINSMKETMKSNQKFKTYIEKTTIEYNNSHRNNQINFFDLYNLPVSRIQNYHQIIKTYESETPKSHKNYDSVQLALNLFEELTEYCKIKSIEAENLTKMRKVAKELNDMTILIASRTLLEEYSSVSVIEDDEDPLFRQLRPVKIYSFNDLIVIIEKGKKGMKFPTQLIYLEKVKDKNIKLETGTYLKTLVFQSQHDAQRFYSLWYTSAEKFWLNALRQNESNAKGNISMFSPRKSFILLSPRKSVSLPGGLDALKEELEKFDQEEAKKQRSKSTTVSPNGIESEEDNPSVNGFYRSQSVKGFTSNRILTNKKIPRIVSGKLKKANSDPQESNQFSGIETTDSTYSHDTPSVSPNGESNFSSPRSSNPQTDRKSDSPPFSEESRNSNAEESKFKNSTEETESLLSMSPDEEGAYRHILSPIDNEKSSPVPKLKLKIVDLDKSDVIENVSSPLGSAREDHVSPLVSPVFSSPRISIQKLTSQYKFDYLTVQDVDTTLVNLQNKLVVLVGEGNFDESKKIIDLMKGITEKFSKGDKKNLDNMMKKAKKF